MPAVRVRHVYRVGVSDFDVFLTVQDMYTGTRRAGFSFQFRIQITKDGFHDIDGVDWDRSGT